jgi:membrane-associated phospholipid phosphatase
MKLAQLLIIVLIGHYQNLALAHAPTHHKPPHTNAPSQLNWNVIKHDYNHYYTKETMLEWTALLSIHALLANTSIDREISLGYQKHIRNETTNHYSKSVKWIGDRTTVLTYAGIYLLSHSKLTPQIHTWSQSVIRTLLVGVPPLLFFQNTIGSYRPRDMKLKSSQWAPFERDHGVSGHAFLGAVPFLVGAKFTHHKPWINYTLYAASTFVALSRLNDDMHYLSQILFGWALAWQATEAVVASNQAWHIQVIPLNEGGLAVGIHWLPPA